MGESTSGHILGVNMSWWGEGGKNVHKISLRNIFDKNKQELVSKNVIIYELFITSYDLRLLLL